MSVLLLPFYLILLCQESATFPAIHQFPSKTRTKAQFGRWSFSNAFCGRKRTLDNPLTRRGASVTVHGVDVVDLVENDCEEDVNNTISRLASKSSEYASLSTGERLSIWLQVIDSFQQRSDEWSTAGSWLSHEGRVWGLYPNDAPSPEALARESQDRFMFGTAVMNLLSSIKKSLEFELSVENQQVNAKPNLLRNKRVVTEGSQGEEELVAHGPASCGAIFPGHSFEVWAVPNKDAINETLSACDVDESTKDLTVTVVLGGGNQPYLGLVDAFHCLFVRKEVVLLKHHPLRPHMMAPYEIILEPLIKRGYFSQVLDRGIPKTRALVSNPFVNHVHLTGSFATDKAVREMMKESHLNATNHNDLVTSELGCVTPWVITPGKYTEKELRHLARSIVFAKKVNGGSNCVSAQAIVLPKDWVAKDGFKTALIAELQRQPNHPCYYPGSKERISKLKQSYNDTCSLVVEAPGIAKDNNPDDHVTLIECGTYGEATYNRKAATDEAFGPLIALIELPGVDDEDKDYLQDVAVRFLNNKEEIYGSLSCSIAASKDSDMASVERAVMHLNYGTVAINTWSFFGYAGMLKGAVWGACPLDQTRQSGNGLVGNYFGIPNPVKMVVRGPSLETMPLLDLAVTPPAIVHDAIHTLTCASSLWLGLIRVMKLLLSRSLSSLLKPIFMLANAVRSRLGKGATR